MRSNRPGRTPRLHMKPAVKQRSAAVGAPQAQNSRLSYMVMQPIDDMSVLLKKDSSQGKRLINLVLTGILSITTGDAEMWY